MPEIGQVLEVTITDVAFGGSGVAKLPDGAVIFIPFTAVGDVLEVAVQEKKKNFYRGEIQRIISPGPDRREPLCRHFGRCGGCAYQHLTYEAQVRTKKNQLASCLQRLGGIKDLPEFDIVFASPKEFNYRNKLRLEPDKPVLEEDGFHLAYGYCLRDNKTFFIVKECPLAMEVLNKALPKAIRSPWGRQNARHKPPMPVTLRADAKGDAHFYFGRAPVNVSWLKEEIHGREVSVPLGSFWQINHQVAEKLLKTVHSWIKPLNAEILIDAYSGVGTFSLAMPDLFLERVLIESDRQAGEAAKLNHAKYDLGCQVISKTTESALPEMLPHFNQEKTLVLLDPPRTGCQPQVLDTILENKPQFIAYVSCNPATLARDLRKLLATGEYHLQKLGMFDMFPQTEHFESAVLLTR